MREGKGEGRGKEEGGGELEARGFGGGEDGMEGVDGTTVVLEASSIAELAAAFGESDESSETAGTVEDDLSHVSRQYESSQTGVCSR